MGWVINPESVTLDAYGNVIRPTEQREPRVDDTTDSTGVISGWTLMPTPQPLSDAIRLSGQQKAVYEIDKRTHRVKFSEETEEFVKVTIEPKDSPA